MKYKFLIPTMLMAFALSACNQSSKNNEAESEAEGLYSTTTVAEHPATKVKLMELPAPMKGVSEQILKQTGYTVSYNKDTRNPNWVAWHLTKSHTYGDHQRTTEVFTENTAVKSPRATDNDYYNSRYDRGHMCPAGDNKWSADAMRETFLFTNICPQNHGLNKYEWNDVEIMCREWARKYGALDIVCGPVYYDKEAPKTIGRNKVWVPDAFFKVVLMRGKDPMAIGFLYKNKGEKQEMYDAVRTVDEMEELTGIDFYPLLEDNLEREVEAEATLSDWPKYYRKKYN